MLEGLSHNAEADGDAREQDIRENRGPSLARLKELLVREQNTPFDITTKKYTEFLQKCANIAYSLLCFYGNIVSYSYLIKLSTPS